MRLVLYTGKGGVGKTTIAAASAARAAELGHRTLVASVDGRLSVNASGNPGMATPGSGDVLTGIVGALLARGLSSFEAARLAVFLHGDAGDRAASRSGVEGLIASDLIDCLPAAFQGLARETP